MGITIIEGEVEIENVTTRRTKENILSLDKRDVMSYKEVKVLAKECQARKLVHQQEQRSSILNDWTFSTVRLYLVIHSDRRSLDALQ